MSVSADGGRRRVKYVSTRGNAPALPFDDVVLAGLARDGGLYVPDHWPAFSAADFAAMRGLDYPHLAGRVMAPFARPAMDEDELTALAQDAYGTFDHPDIAPLRPLGGDLHLLELFHGPTLAFKDLALQLLGRLFDRILGARGERITVVGATSGDTGSAAIEACRDRRAIDIFILHPHGRVSEVQRRQMTTVTAANVHNVAVEGTFDDCQALVKAMFNDAAFRDRWRLAAVNSINWARVVAQVVYYVHAALALGAPDRAVSFAVPTGNFGNVFAGYVARTLGLPVARLIVGSNRNDILTRFFATGHMRTDRVVPTLSPSMDIQVSSNFERLLFDLVDRDGAAVERWMRQFADTGAFAVGGALLERLGRLFSAARFDDAETTATIRRVYEETGQLVDPHTAIGIAAARAAGGDRSIPVVAQATAHPAKFPDAVMAATGVRPALPPRLADLFRREERYHVLPARLEAVEHHIAAAMTGREVMA
jgi:threonine synthase